MDEDIKLPPSPTPSFFAYKFQSHYGPVWRSSSEIWNGLKPDATTGLHTTEALEAYARAAVEADRAARKPLTDELRRHIAALTEIVRMPNAEYVADAHNKASDEWLSAHEAAIALVVLRISGLHLLGGGREVSSRKLLGKRHELHSVMGSCGHYTSLPPGQLGLADAGFPSDLALRHALPEVCQGLLNRFHAGIFIHFCIFVKSVMNYSVAHSYGYGRQDFP